MDVPHANLLYRCYECEASDGRSDPFCGLFSFGSTGMSGRSSECLLVLQELNIRPNQIQETVSKPLCLWAVFTEQRCSQVVRLLDKGVS
jgi:hypothetical protein